MRLFSRIISVFFVSLAVYGHCDRLVLYTPGSDQKKVAIFHIHQAHFLEVELFTVGEVQQAEGATIPVWQYILKLLQTLGSERRLLFRIHSQSIEVLVGARTGETVQHILTLNGNADIQAYFQNPVQSVALLLNEGLTLLLTEALAGGVPAQIVTFSTMPPVAVTPLYMPIDALLGFNLVPPDGAAAIPHYDAYLAEDSTGENQCCSHEFMLTPSHNMTVLPASQLSNEDEFENVLFRLLKFFVRLN